MPSRSARELTATARVRDLQHLDREYTRLNHSFTAATAEVFRQRIAQLQQRIATLSYGGFIMGIAHAVAAANDGHTDVMAMEHLRRLPLRFAWFAEGLYITATAPDYREVLGARVETLAGRTSQSLLTALAAYIPGHPQHVRNWSTAYMSAPEALEGIGLAQRADEIEIGLTQRDGAPLVCEIAPQAWGGADVRIREWRNLVPRARPDGLSNDWVHVLDDCTSLPEYLREPDKLYCHAWDEARNLLYVRVSTSMHAGAIRLDDYLKAVLEEAAARRPQTVVVDLRFNTGGLFSLTHAFSIGLHKVLAQGGRIFVVTGAATFSAGICLTAFLKFYGEGCTTLVGERVGDNDTFWAEGDFIVLPNSGLKVAYVDGFFDVTSDRPRLGSHYWMNAVYGVPAGSLEPDLHVRQSFADYLAGRDASMEAILKEL